MGKKNSKLKQETVESLTKDTYCKYVLLYKLSKRISQNNSETQKILLFKVMRCFHSYAGSWIFTRTSGSNNPLIFMLNIIAVNFFTSRAEKTILDEWIGFGADVSLFRIDYFSRNVPDFHSPLPRTITMPSPTALISSSLSWLHLHKRSVACAGSIRYRLYLSEERYL